MKSKMKSKVTNKSMLRSRLRVFFKSINCILFVLFCILAGYFLTNVIDHYQAKKTMQRSRRVQRTLPLDKKRVLAKMGTRA